VRKIDNTPFIRISSPRPESLALDLEDIDINKDGDDDDDDDDDDILRKVSNAVLPDEIAQELEALSRVDNERHNRIAKLEKLRRGEEILAEEEEDANEEDSKYKGPLPDSAESSVEGMAI
jgi:hypothetical protein